MALLTASEYATEMSPTYLPQSVPGGNDSRVKTWGWGIQSDVFKAKVFIICNIVLWTKWVKTKITHTAIFGEDLKNAEHQEYKDEDSKVLPSRHQREIICIENLCVYKAPEVS